MVHWHELGRLDDLPMDQLVPRQVRGAAVVLVRTGQTVTALRDRCPHRFAPLSLGKLVDGVVHCPYHGLRFDLDGSCVFNPHGDGRIPTQARVPVWPVRQEDGLVFIGIEQEEIDA
jgi:phenylpropionate dioxygenase-like ring-hydroxylating dioxygenase large terminal subunit